MTTSYVLALDLGQSPDATAGALIEYEHTYEREYRLRGLRRFPRGTPYSELAAPIRERIERAPLKGRTNLAVDATGPGRPVVDYLREELSPAPLFAITITSGYGVGGGSRDLTVPKRDLVATISLIFEQRRLHIAESMRDTEALLDELLAYRRTTTERGMDTYSAASGRHDDLVLALSLALWLAENRLMPDPNVPTVFVPRGDIPGIVAMGEGLLF
jgi:Terminase RNaseH-like domain